MPVLKLEKDDPKKELAFEIAFQKTLTSQQRYQMMIKRSKDILARLIKNGHRKPFEIIKRK